MVATPDLLSCFFGLLYGLGALSLVESVFGIVGAFVAGFRGRTVESDDSGGTVRDSFDHPAIATRYRLTACSAESVRHQAPNRAEEGPNRW